jgi:hypothetical protein
MPHVLADGGAGELHQDADQPGDAQCHLAPCDPGARGGSLATAPPATQRVASCDGFGRLRCRAAPSSLQNLCASVTPCVEALGDTESDQPVKDEELEGFCSVAPAGR